MVIYILLWSMPDSGRLPLFQKDDVELLGGNQGTLQSKVNPKCIR